MEAGISCFTTLLEHNNEYIIDNNKLHFQHTLPIRVRQTVALNKFARLLNTDNTSENTIESIMRETDTTPNKPAEERKVRPTNLSIIKNHTPLGWRWEDPPSQPPVTPQNTQETQTSSSPPTQDSGPSANLRPRKRFTSASTQESSSQQSSQQTKRQKTNQSHFISSQNLPSLMPTKNKHNNTIP
jgi:hypothetical protein